MCRLKMLVAKFVRHADNKSPFKERKKKDTNDEALEATTVTLLCVVWENWCDNLWKLLFRPTYTERPFNKKEKRYERRLRHCYMSFGGFNDAVWAKHTASTPIIRVLSKKERKIRTTRLSRRWPWHCYVLFEDISDKIREAHVWSPLFSIWDSACRSLL